MNRYLVYTPPAAGHVFPLVPGLLRLRERGYAVHVRTAPELVDRLRAEGLDAEPVDERITASVRRPGGPDGVDGMADLFARGAWEAEDLRRAVAEVAPTALLVDTNTYGAATAAQATGLPWAITVPSILAMQGKGIPPYGIGLAPKRGPLGAVRDAMLWKVVERVFGKNMLPGLNTLRVAEGLPVLRSPLEYYRLPDRLIVLTGAPLEYPRTDLPAHVRMVGGQVWDPPASTPDWLLEPGDPWVLVTCSTHYLGDEDLAVKAVEALRDKPVRVLVTLADAYASRTLPTAANVRVERFVPHGPVLRHAAAVVCPAGMGIVTKAVAAGVPVVAVPWGRDQPEVARRVQQAGTGVILPAKRLTSARLAAAVDTALGLRDRARTVAAGVDPARAAERFADAAEEVAVQRPQPAV
ncbi:nucleotide disphospho-sugar-binding domain-containing protein [Dactylosporangium sp. NPDC000521]|uniref:nucleotide disphospho-sugar-binding domain-containing protein n=1 Tax=Dactylosporangium sp. NPDC000521 TaxID=3363975 RepID=UPI003674E3F2